MGFSERSRTVLVTGFEKFRGRSLNSSGQGVLALRGLSIPNVDLHVAILPVVYAAGFQKLLAIQPVVKPDILILTGEYGSEDEEFRLEISPKNLMKSVTLDNAGQRGAGDPIKPGGEALLHGTLPFDDILRAVTAAGFNARKSTDAGGFICNDVYYRSLDHLQHHAPDGLRGISCGFVHIPTTDAQGSVRDEQHEARVAQMLKTVIEVTIAKGG